MNAKMLFKMVFLIFILLLLVMMGMDNRDFVTFRLRPLLPRPITQPAALMYFSFFAVGLVTGSVISMGAGKKGGNSSNRGSKPDK